MPGRSRRAFALASTALAMGLLAAMPARAQSASSVSTIESQIKALQRELQELKRQMAGKEAAVRAARDAAAQAKQSAAAAQAAAAAVPPPAPPGAVATAAPPNGFLVTVPQPNALNTIPGTSSGPSGFGSHIGDPDLSKGAVRIGGVTIQLGGFIEAAGVFRTKNQSGDLASSFTATPFNQSPLAHEAETVFSSRQSRISLLAFGDPLPNVRLSGYYEMDFQAGSSNGNNTESNSYAPRVRQLFASVDYDDRADDIGLHVLAGQTYSLITPYYSGLLPRSDNTPRTIDPQYLVGFTWARQPQVRVDADFFDHRLWVALSAEAPQTTFATSGYTSTTGVSIAGTSVNELTLPTGGIANINNPGISPDYSGNNFSVNGVPDFVAKIAADPGFGHYEAYGLVRVLTDRVDPAVGVGHNNNSLGGGVGASTAIHVFSGLDLAGDVLVGDGIGRYGSGQLSDATIKPNGTVSPIPEIEALIGAIGHPVPSVDVYGYLGTEQESKTAFTYSGKAYGLGSPLFVNTGCGTELSTSTCTGNTEALYEATIGGWWRPYRGSYGTLQTGLQYSHIWREAFYGVGGKPAANQDAVFLSFRYYPFQ